jgi:glc operon protein GlcG
MKTKIVLTEADTALILEASVAHAAIQAWAVCIAIVDDGGHLLRFVRLDNAAPASVGIAQAKASSAAIRRRETLLDEKMVNEGRFSALSMPNITFLEGGVPIMIEGQCVGAVGVSGVKSSEDAEIAKVGIAALL